MGFVFSSFVHDLESNMRAITERAYDSLASKIWWPRVAKETPLVSKKDVLVWLLDTAQIEYVNRLGGEVTFDDLVSQQHSIEYKAATAGLKLNRYQMEDIVNGIPGGGAMDVAGNWSRQIGAYMAYFPQKKIAELIRNGDQAGFTSYDGELFFDTDHPVNPFDDALGTYANVFTGAASGAYPGALPIDASVSVDVAVENLGKAIAYIESIKSPNGEDPRLLTVKGILHPPALTTRVQQITNAQVIAQAASSGGGSANVEAVVRNWGLEDPIKGTELGAGFPNGSDTDFYLAIEDITNNDLGGLVWGVREAFGINQHDTMTDVELDRANDLEWLCRGANVGQYGHPFLMFKCKST
jgi:phage major head subunit gpT-like protein